MKSFWKSVWNVLIDSKDELMVRVYAFCEVKEYRIKVMLNLIIFFTALISIYEISCLHRGLKLDIFDLLALSGCLTILLLLVCERIKNRRSKTGNQDSAENKDIV
jgi:hypothetical protein